MSMRVPGQRLNLKGTDYLVLVSGALAGVVGLLVFLALHARRILPIWFILPAGLVFAGAGGVHWAGPTRSCARRCPSARRQCS